MSNGQAKAGGEIGVNGEFYDGGQFLPSSPSTVKGSQRATISKGKKFEVAPYVWEPAPADDMLSIYDRINRGCTDNRRECSFVKGQGFTGFKFTGIFRTKIGGKYDVKTDTWEELPVPQDRVEFLENMIERFNNGERWFALSEDPYHYKNAK